jgi:methylenetetrahydrofolate reductase (NADPH)
MGAPITTPSISIELFPPKDEAGEEKLWNAIEELRAIHPDFVSVTYGAGGSTRDRTIRIAKEFTARTSISTVAHLTCVGSTQEELSEILMQYQAAGIESILALRGDPAGGPSTPWVSHPGGFDHADQLVELAKSHGGFKIGVAAFPDGHPNSNGDLARDIEVLLRKEELGATFATTQFFFDASRYFELVEKLAKAGSALPVIAGILPITNLKLLGRMAELNGTPIPTHVTDRFEGHEENPQTIREIGIEIATELSQELMKESIPGLHFYAMNTSYATLKIMANLGISRGA